MDLVNYETPLANYGSSTCPNAPNPCYCTGKCTINQVYGPSPYEYIKPALIAAARKQLEIDSGVHLLRKPAPINAAHAAKIATILEHNKAQPVFVQNHNAEEAAEVSVITAKAQDTAQFAPLKAVLNGLENILRYKNKAYGNSGLSEVGVLSKSSALEKLLARADDKIARIKNSDTLRKNDICDLLGYLVLICAKQGWNNFSDQQD